MTDDNNRKYPGNETPPVTARALRYTCLKFITAATYLTTIFGILAVVGGVVLAFIPRDDPNNSDGTVRPFIAAGAATVFAGAMVAAVVLAGLSFAKWKVYESMEADNEAGTP